ncbi:PhzF family phenazine biosynthesis protein [Acetobacterium bakii]|nr:PhzF family phenazine biosynthesis protein [Acetobacterium bakii]
MKQYVVDAFAEHVFEGNPAGVCNMYQDRISLSGKAVLYAIAELFI